MMKIFYNSWVTKLLMKDYVAITICCFVFTKYLKKEVENKQYLINHEMIHAQQWSEHFIFSAIIIFIILLITKGEGYLWFLICPLMFYIIYCLEFLYKIFYYSFTGIRPLKNKSYWKNAYKMLSFEIEARFSEYDNNFLENRNYFSSYKYLFKLK